MLNEEYTYKVLLLGNSTVGKSSILYRYTSDSFTDNFISTIGVDFHNAKLKHHDKDINLQIWDTAGQERFNTIVRSYYRETDFVILVYDVSSVETFQNIRHWLREIKENANNNNLFIILVGNKSDLIQRKVNKKKGIKLAKEYGLEFLETSAKNNENVDKLFQIISEYAFRRADNDERVMSDKIVLLGEKLNKKKKNKRKCCSIPF